jgi:glycosyltransferase involved in cell wall biosynthesis
MKPGIDIILPCYHPNDTWHIELTGFHDFISKYYSVNFILVNDGSGELKLREQLKILAQKSVPVQYISYPVNRGKGFALRAGVRASQSDTVLYTDVDFPFTNESMRRVLDALATGNSDIVAGYRSGSYYDNKMTFFRKLLSRAFRYFISAILRMPIEDTQCGLKGFNAAGKEKFLATTINRYLFDFEFIYISSRDRKIRITPVEVQLKDNVVFSKMRPVILLQEGINLLRVLFKR